MSDPSAPLRWWARTSEILWMGPYDSAEAAWRAVLGYNGTPVNSAIVWCSREDPRVLDGQK